MKEQNDCLLLDGKGLCYPTMSIDCDALAELLVEQGEEIPLTLDHLWTTEKASAIEALLRYLTSNEDGDLDSDDGKILSDALDTCVSMGSAEAEDVLWDAAQRMQGDYVGLVEELLSMATSDNTYNHESSLAGAVNYTVIPVDPENGDCYDACILLFEVNTGGDPRGGYRTSQAVFYPGGLATCQLISPCIDAYVTDSEGNSCFEDASTGYHGSCSFDAVIDGRIDGLTVTLDEDDCPVFDGFDLLATDEDGNKLTISFMLPFVDC